MYRFGGRKRLTSYPQSVQGAESHGKQALGFPVLSVVSDLRENPLSLPSLA